MGRVRGDCGKCNRGPGGHSARNIWCIKMVIPTNPGRNKRAKTRFASGHEPFYRKKKSESPAEDPPRPPITRLAKEDFDDIVDVAHDGLSLEICNEDNQDVSGILLRPREDPTDEYTDCTENETLYDIEGYRVLHMGFTQDLWNTAIKGHREHEECSGELTWDKEKEIKVGLGWKEALKCNECGFETEAVRLYEDIRTGKPGRPANAMNVGVQVGLHHTMSGNSDLQILLSSTGIPPPSSTGLQHTANKVSQASVDLNEKDMEAQRDRAKRLNRLKGNKDGFAAEADSMYNIGLREGGGRTLTQPATICITTISENVTKSKKVVGSNLANKHCAIADALRVKGDKVVCPNHKGKCTQTIEKEGIIGDESRNVEAAYRSMQKHSVNPVTSITTDGDSRSAEAISKVNAEMGFKPPVKLRDTRHLSAGQARFSKNQKFTKEAFPGRLKKDRDVSQKCFSEDIKRRCNAEFNQAFSVYKNDLPEMKRQLANTSKAVISCYEGNCGELCDKYSFVCHPRDQKPWQHDYLQEGETLNISAKDRTILKKICDWRLSAESVEKTRNNTNTQKSEAINRSIRHVLPKGVLRKRTSEGRLHSAIHSVNNGVGRSVLMKLKAQGIRVTKDNRVFSAFVKAQNRQKYHKQRQKSEQYKARRRYFRKTMYAKCRNRDDTVAKKCYAKSMMDLEDMQRVTQVISAEHTYATSPVKKVMSSYNLRKRTTKHNALTPTVSHDHSYA